MESLPIALVTGGARRVGAEIVRALARAGYAVRFTYHRSADEASRLVNALSGSDIRAIEADFFEPDAVDGLLEHLGDDRRRVRLLVNNASLYLKDEEPRAAMHLRVNYETPTRLTAALATDLRANHGSVINMLDIAAERPYTGYRQYCASKAALWNATLSFARKLAPEVTVNGIAPGVVDWPDDMPQASRDAYLKKIPLARAGTPADVANLVRFLVTDGRYITGQVIRLDGGRSIGW